MTTILLQYANTQQAAAGWPGQADPEPDPDPWVRGLPRVTHTIAWDALQLEIHPENNVAGTPWACSLGQAWYFSHNFGPRPIQPTKRCVGSSSDLDGSNHCIFFSHQIALFSHKIFSTLFFSMKMSESGKIVLVSCIIDFDDVQLWLRLLSLNLNACKVMMAFLKF